MLMILYKSNHIVTHQNFFILATRQKSMMPTKSSNVLRNGLSCHGQVSFSDIFLKKKAAILTKPN